jgi:hypothetical protein
MGCSPSKLNQPTISATTPTPEAKDPEVVETVIPEKVPKSEASEHLLVTLFLNLLGTGTFSFYSPARR